MLGTLVHTETEKGTCKLDHKKTTAIPNVPSLSSLQLHIAVAIIAITLDIRGGVSCSNALQPMLNVPLQAEVAV